MGWDMGRYRFTGSAVLVVVLTGGIGAWGCGGNSPGAEAAPQAPTSKIYDEFLESRQLAATLTSAAPGEDAVARERKIVEDRKLLRNLEAGVASKRALLADAQRDVPAESPNESLYFQVWSGHFGDGDKPAFKRLAGGGIEYAGKQFTKDTALQCAVPARLKGYTHKPFLDCLSTLQSSSASR
jgi:hypothetical protein